MEILLGAFSKHIYLGVFNETHLIFFFFFFFCRDGVVVGKEADAVTFKLMFDVSIGEFMIFD